MFRFPHALLDAEVARQYCHTDAASVIETSDHVIVSLYLDRDPDNYWVEADDRLGPMVQARSRSGEGHAADNGRRRRRCPGTGPAAAALPRK